MNLTEDLLVFVKDAKDHNLRVTVDSNGVTVYLIYDPTHEGRENEIIPIHFTTLEEFAYIPHDEYIDKFNATDFGITFEEMKIIVAIMEYLESHAQEIVDLCRKYDSEFRCDKEEDIVEWNVAQDIMSNFYAIAFVYNIENSRIYEFCRCPSEEDIQNLSDITKTRGEQHILVKSYNTDWVRIHSSIKA